ncbi:MAG TPA: DUF177 domain-containing protein [Anaerolineae bacterium]|nr:DUF177 domain-containing protein [Anaerolineae bacterium]
MRYNVAQLLMGPTGGQRVYDLEADIHGLDPEIKPLRPLSGTVTLMRTSQGILATGTLRTSLVAQCRRCLELCDTEIEIDLEEEFYPAVHFAEAPLDEMPEENWDEALQIDEHHVLDLSEVIRQDLLLAIPMQTLCKPDCAGLCPRCGGNRNLGECTCEEEAIDPRWAALQVLIGP